MSLFPSKLSMNGAAFIGRFEGFRSSWYLDAVGVHTIGFGHTGPLPAGFHAPLTLPEAHRLLIHDADRYAAAVAAIRPRVTRQARFDALTSFAFNLGAGIFEPSTSIGHAVRMRLGRPSAVAEALLRYNHGGGRVLPGLTRRRQAERHLWLTGRYDG